MSEYSMMAGSVPWPLAYGFLALGMGALGICLYYILHKMERPASGNRGIEGFIGTGVMSPMDEVGRSPNPRAGEGIHP